MCSMPHANSCCSFLLSRSNKKEVQLTKLSFQITSPESLLTSMKYEPIFALVSYLLGKLLSIWFEVLVSFYLLPYNRTSDM